MPMNKQLFIVMVWAFLDLEDGSSEVSYLGENPVLSDGQEAALQPAIDELVILYNMHNPTDKLPVETNFFATIKTSYRGMYFDANDNNPSSD